MTGDADRTLTAVLGSTGDGATSVGFTFGGAPVLLPGDLARVRVDGDDDRGLTDVRVEREDPDGLVVVGRVPGTGLTARVTVRTWPAHSVAYLTVRLTNAGPAPHAVRAADPLSGTLARPVSRLLGFTSAWGAEYEPQRVEGTGDVNWSVSSGRSSQGRSPWVGLECDGFGLVVCPVWSGNWHVSVTGAHPVGRLSAGISPEGFEHRLPPGESFTAPGVVLGAGPDLDCAAVGVATMVGAHWLPRTPWSDALPVEWNHWWPYEDGDIDEARFLANSSTGASLGFEVSTLDAGWFGAADPDADWTRVRGDWHLENRARFPRGVAAVADAVRARQQRFGVWMEPEAVGVDAELRTGRPGLQARRDDDPPATPLDLADPGWLGYVCLGSAEGREFVTDALDSMVARTACSWLKWDFNLDPGLGCSRADHGHGPGDGLYAHYTGLYEVLDGFRARHPDVLLEACSSGGLRLDLGVLRHVHCAFLSDPDWTEHHLQVLWGASLMLPPAAMLHWPWSEWRGNHPQQTLDVSERSDLPVAAFDTIVRAGMLTRFGVSLRLPDMRVDLRDRLRRHVDVFRRLVRPFVRGGVLRRLTGQPLRYGRGERVPAFQLSLDDRHLLAAFVLGPDSGPAPRPGPAAGGAMPDTVTVRP
ncbi:MAG: alpha-galactosidase, partial [Actinocatenispora sp.]